LFYQILVGLLAQQKVETNCALSLCGYLVHICRLIYVYKIGTYGHEYINGYPHKIGGLQIWIWMLNFISTATLQLTDVDFTFVTEIVDCLEPLKTTVNALSRCDTSLISLQAALSSASSSCSNRVQTLQKPWLMFCRCEWGIVQTNPLGWQHREMRSSYFWYSLLPVYLCCCVVEMC